MFSTTAVLSMPVRGRHVKLRKCDIHGDALLLRLEAALTPDAAAAGAAGAAAAAQSSLHMERCLLGCGRFVGLQPGAEGRSVIMNGEEGWEDVNQTFKVNITEAGSQQTRREVSGWQAADRSAKQAIADAVLPLCQPGTTSQATEAAIDALISRLRASGWLRQGGEEVQEEVAGGSSTHHEASGSGSSATEGTSSIHGLTDGTQQEAGSSCDGGGSQALVATSPISGLTAVSSNPQQQDCDDKGAVSASGGGQEGPAAVTAACCVVCGARTPDLRRCRGCRSVDVRYCGVECQRKHWPLHKAVCRAVQREQARCKSQLEEQGNE